MFYAAYFRDGAPAANRPITFLFNGGPGSSTVWLHMGAFGPVRVRDRSTRATRRAALCDRQQRPEPARRQRPRLHRRARHRLQPDRRQGQGKGLLRGRPGHRRLRPVHHPVPVEIRPLELAQICVRRKLWDDARRRPRAGAPEAGRRPQRPDPAVRHPQLGPRARRPAGQSRHRHALCRLAADLCGDRLVSQPRSRDRPAELQQLSRPGRGLRDARLCGRSDQGQRTARRRAPAHREQLSGLHRPSAFPICSRPISGSNMARSRRSCSPTRRRPRARSTRASSARRSTR